MANIDKQIQASERQVQALELRKQGQSFASIANSLGFSDASGARKAIYRALRQTLHEPADAFYQLVIERLEMLLSKHMPAAMEGDVKSTEIVIKIIN